MRTLVCLLLALAPLPLAAAERPNVLFIAVDDLRPQLGCYGDTLVQSPHIDALARAGLVFDRAYCQQALCSPSRISLLSGRRPESSGIFTIGPTLRSQLPDVTTLPQHFKKHGYFCRSLGKIYHVGIDDPRSWSIDSWQSPKPRYGPEGTAKVKAATEALRAAGQTAPERGPGRPFYAGPPFESPELEDGALLDGDCAREAARALGELAGNPEQPFFLAVGFANPHVPWVAPKKYWDLYAGVEIPLPENRYAPRGAPGFAAQSGADFYWYGGRTEVYKVTPEFGRDCLHGYLAAISYIDAQVGLLLAELDRLKLRENTIVVLWGDHGYYMGEHDWWGGKHNNYEGATRVPLIVSAPGMKAAGKHSAALVELIDLYPTLAELAGLPAAEDVEGTSFAPLLSDPARSWKTAAFSCYPKGGNLGIAMRTDRYRYVEWKDKNGELMARELYDHEIDPEENQNLAEQPEQQELLEQLAAQLAAGWRGAVPKE